MRFINIMKRKKTGYYKDNNKGVTLIEALVSVVIVAIGFLSVYQLTSYAINSIDSSIDRTKLNFLSEMMAEDMMADPSNAKKYQYSQTCSYNNNSGQNLYDLRRNKWNEKFKDMIDNCKTKDQKQTIIGENADRFSARINIKNKDGKQRKYLGVIIKK